MRKIRNKITIVLCFIGMIGGILRLYHISSPVADWHSWRQADTAAVARNFIKFGVDPLRPRYDDLSNIQSGKDNPMGYRMVEAPLYQITAVYLYKIIHTVSIEIILRLVSITATAGSIILLGLLLQEFGGAGVAVIGASLYAVLPFSIYYGRSILPDPFATFFALVSLNMLRVSIRQKKRLFLIVGAGIAAAISVLVRPMAVFLLLPALYFLFSEPVSFRRRFFYFVIYGLLLSVPLFVWRKWIGNFPEGIPASDWLYNKDNVRFKGAWFYWLFARRLGELILGYWGLIPFALGIVTVLKKKDIWFSGLWLSGILLYFTIFAGGNVQHDYYQALLIPVIVWFTAKGIWFLCEKHDGVLRIPSVVIAGVSILFLLSFSWYTIRTFFWINRPDIIEAGKTADRMVPKDAKVIAPYNGDTSFLYQTNRQGWPIGFDIDNKIAMGAKYYITVSPNDSDTETRDLAKKYTVLVRNEKFAIIDLTRIK